MALIRLNVVDGKVRYLAASVVFDRLARIAINNVKLQLAPLLSWHLLFKDVLDAPCWLIGVQTRVNSIVD
jgi:hypothetical protein